MHTLTLGFITLFTFIPSVFFLDIINYKTNKYFIKIIISRGQAINKIKIFKIRSNISIRGC